MAERKKGQNQLTLYLLNKVININKKKRKVKVFNSKHKLSVHLLEYLHQVFDTYDRIK